MSGKWIPHPFTPGRLTQAPPTEHPLFLFPVSGAQLPRLSLISEAQMSLAKRPSLAVNFVHTFSVLYVIFIPMPLLHCLSATSFPPFILTSLNLTHCSDVNAQAGSMLLQFAHQ